MKRARHGGDDPMQAAIARWESAKQTLPLVIEAALVLYEGGTWEDAALALVDEYGVEWPVARRWRREAGRGRLTRYLPALTGRRGNHGCRDGADHATCLQGGSALPGKAHAGCDESSTGRQALPGRFGCSYR